MAYTNATLRNYNSAPPGRGLYRYDTTDDYPTVDTANYFNNQTNDTLLAVGDFIMTCHWTTAVFTGTINQVSALSGYVVTSGGERLVFSMMNNRAASALRAKRAEDAVGIRLARFERIFSGGDRGPASATASVR